MWEVYHISNRKTLQYLTVWTHSSYFQMQTKGFSSSTGFWDAMYKHSLPDKNIVSKMLVSSSKLYKASTVHETFSGLAQG